MLIMDWDGNQSYLETIIRAVFGWAEKNYEKLLSGLLVGCET
jgi:hypothetical protein